MKRQAIGFGVSKLALGLLIGLAPATVWAQHHGGGGGHMGGGHMGGGGFHGGSMHSGGFHGGGFSSGGFRSAPSMRMAAPSHSFAPSRSFAPSHAPAVRSVAPRAGAGWGAPAARSASPAPANLSSAGGARGGTAHSVMRPNFSSGAGTAAGGRHHHNFANGASPAQLQRVNTNINTAVKAHAGHHASGAAANLAHAGAANLPHSAALASQATHIRANWNQHPHQCFHHNWWVGRSLFGFGGLGWYGGWGYSPWLNYNPWWYWWGRPSWNSCASYLPYGWNNGYYYDYGAGGNVIYDNGQVTVDGQTIGTDAEYAQSAYALAQVTPEELKAVKPGDWMALGTFSMAVSDSEVDPARVVQLAVSKNGLVSGTIYNRTSGNTYAIQGRVDDNQRVAFTIGDDSDTVLETGIFNLTQDQTPVLCHFGTSQTQTYMLVRLPQPEHEATPEAAATVQPEATPPAAAAVEAAPAEVASPR